MRRRCLWPPFMSAVLDGVFCDHRVDAMPNVNPKDMKPQVYKDPRPAEMFTQYHRSARRGVGWIYDFARAILTIPTILLYRARAIGVENVPATGPVILAPNHFSQWDHFFAAVYLPGIVRGESVAPAGAKSDDQWFGGRRDTAELPAAPSGAVPDASDRGRETGGASGSW